VTKPAKKRTWNKKYAAVDGQHEEREVDCSVDLERRPLLAALVVVKRRLWGWASGIWRE
jgi:hypothetical protein